MSIYYFGKRMRRDAPLLETAFDENTSHGGHAGLFSQRTRHDVKLNYLGNARLGLLKALLEIKKELLDFQQVVTKPAFRLKK
jgi:hypothetical protein